MEYKLCKFSALWSNNAHSNLIYPVNGLAIFDVLIESMTYLLSYGMLRKSLILISCFNPFSLNKTIGQCYMSRKYMWNIIYTTDFK